MEGSRTVDMAMQQKMNQNTTPSKPTVIIISKQASQANTKL
jgi:hypothetical protein